MISLIRENTIYTIQNVVIQVNNKQLLAYWNTENVIVEHDKAITSMQNMGNKR